jgi:hypothetical protein
MSVAMSRSQRHRVRVRQARPGAGACSRRHSTAGAGCQVGRVSQRGRLRFFSPPRTQHVRTPSWIGDWLGGVAMLVAIGSWTLALVLLAG